MAIVLNLFLVWVYWSYAPVVLATQEQQANVIFYEDNMGEITNSSKRITFNWSQTSGDPIIFDHPG